MAFEVRVNGQPVHKEEAQVIGVSIQSARGELYKAGISTEGVIDVILQTVKEGDPIRLDQLEAARRQWESERVQGKATGTVPAQMDHDMAIKQYISGPGTQPGLEVGDVETPQYGPPNVDLTQGLDPSDENYSDLVTARVEAYGSHGDAQKAIDENLAQGQEPSQVPPPETTPPPDKTVGEPVEDQPQEPQEAEPTEEQPREGEEDSSFNLGS